MHNQLLRVDNIPGISRPSFALSRYPVLSFDGANLAETPWIDALSFCNKLCKENGMPVSYDMDTGRLIDETGVPAKTIDDVIGFRLPTFIEWSHAAMGWNGKKDNRSFFHQKGLFDKAPYPEYSWFNDKEKHSITDVHLLAENCIGFVGMLGYCHEWYCDSGFNKDTMCYWESYICNYNNDSSYQVTNKGNQDEEKCGFRIACTDLKREHFPIPCYT